MDKWMDKPVGQTVQQLLLLSTCCLNGYVAFDIVIYLGLSLESTPCQPRHLSLSLTDLCIHCTCHNVFLC